MSRGERAHKKSSKFLQTTFRDGTLLWCMASLDAARVYRKEPIVVHGKFSRSKGLPEGTYCGAQ